MSQLEFIIGGESVFVDDISDQLINQGLHYQNMPPQDMYYVNLPSSKMTVKDIKEHIIKDLPELIVSKIDETFNILSNNNESFDIEQFYINENLLEICINNELLERYFGSSINQSADTSRFICNVISVCVKSINNWRDIYNEYRMNQMVNPSFNINKCKYQIHSLIKLLLNELK